MVSQRVHGTQSPPLVELGQLASSTIGCISLGQGAPFYHPPDWLMEQFQLNLLRSSIHRYTADPGILPLRKAVANKLQSDQNVMVEPDQLVITPGANQAFYNLIVTLTDPGDEVILLSPYYFNHLMACDMVNVVAKVVRLAPDFSLDLEAISSVMTSRTKLLVLVNPGNPTGRVHTRGELQQLLDLCRSQNVIVAADETYEYFTYGGADHIALGSLTHSGIVGLGSFSKTFGIPGWRLGYYYGDCDLVEQSLKVQDTIGICAPHPSQQLGQLLLQSRAELIPPIVELMEANYSLASKLLGEIDWLRSTPSQGAYYLFPKQTTGRPTAEVVKELIKDSGVYIVPGAGFGASWVDYCRISFANVNAEQLIEAFDRLSRYSG